MTFRANRAIYESVIRDAVSSVRGRLWVATAYIEDIYPEFVSL